MTSRPGPGIHESLQHRGGGPLRPIIRRQPSKPLTTIQNAPPQDAVDPNLDLDRRSSEDGVNRTRRLGHNKIKSGFPEGIQTTISDQGRPPPKGKPQVFFCNTIDHDAESPAIPLPSPQGQPSTLNGTTLPMPPRPGSCFPGDISQIALRDVRGGGKQKQDVATQHQGPSGPPVLLPGGKPADLFPWSSGNHPEDMLSEGLVKAGINNKPQIMNETNTARPSLWSNIKPNKQSGPPPGLATLSSLFVAVLEKRQASGRLMTPNGFKAPPRITLKDASRETWLRDLANPKVSLRRLSRTIPHSITGKLLLEQCLNKNIPTPRAVWLAKCVGINEMRSHQRKGAAVTGTITWVRGWTNCVEQFVESMISTCGQGDWKPRITYTLRLATSLYKEHLLEEDHFLDWLLRSLDTSLPERLFIWLLLVSVFWQDLTASRRRGRRLADSLLNHADKLYQTDEGDEKSPVHSFLDNVISKLVITSPSSLLLPRTWDKHRPILLRVSEGQPSQRISHLIEDLDRRNKRLSRPSQSSKVESRNVSRAFVSLLDSIDYTTTVHIDALCSECMELVSDVHCLISKALHWASSIYREGIHRVYIVTRLLRKWNSLGFDTDSGILSFLHSMAPRKDVDLRNIFKIVAELVRSKTFSVGKYLQWLIATGSLNASQDLSEPESWPVRLITEIPLRGLPTQVQNLRSTLLQGSGYSVDAEQESFDTTQDSIIQHMPRLFHIDHLMGHPMDTSTAHLSSTVRLELSVWLRQQVAENMEMDERLLANNPSLDESPSVSTITVSDFCTVRAYIEDFADISVLADIVGVASTSLDFAVLAAIADTLHYHYKALGAIGAFKPLFQKVASRYASLRTLRLPEREFVISLLDLAETAKADSQLLSMLYYDLTRSDQKYSVAACSPVSDNMTEGSTMDNDDEIDRILSSGTTMDQQIMSRVFNKITSKLEMLVSKGSPSFDNYTSWFHRLRNFEDKAFEKLLAEWIASLLLNHQGKVMVTALPPLVASGCLTFSQFLDISKRCVENRKGGNDDGAVRMCVETLNALLPSDNFNRLCHLYDTYRYRLEQRKFCQTSNKEVLRFIRQTIERRGSQLSTGIDAQISSLLGSNRLRTIIRHLAITDLQSLGEALGIESSAASETINSCIKSLLDGLLDPSSRLNLTERSIEDQVKTIVDIADELSLPFCQLELRHIFMLHATTPESTNDAASTALLESIKAAVEEDRSCWPDLIAKLDNNLNNKIREHAEREILNNTSFLSPTVDGSHETSRSDDELFLKRYLTVIDFTASDSPLEGQSQTFSSLIEKLRGILEVFNKLAEPSSQNGSAFSTAIPSKKLCLWLNALLQLSVVHVSIPSNKTANQQGTFLWALRSLFTHPCLQALPSMTEFIVDIATVFTDDITEEVRNHLIRLDSAKPTDSRCAFVFGTARSSDGWLGLLKTAATSASFQSATPQSPTVNPVSNQNQQAYQSPHFNSASPLQRSISQQQQQAQSRMYPQYSQHSQHKAAMPQFPRMNTGSGQTPQAQFQQMQHLQQMQQIQGLAQQRVASPVSGQRQPAPQSPALSQNNNQMATGASRTGAIRQPEVRPMPFPLRWWEILPESGGQSKPKQHEPEIDPRLVNETALNLTLFGARLV